MGIYIYINVIICQLTPLVVPVFDTFALSRIVFTLFGRLLVVVATGMKGHVGCQVFACLGICACYCCLFVVGLYDLPD